MGRPYRHAATIVNLVEIILAARRHHRLLSRCVVRSYRVWNTWKHPRPQSLSILLGAEGGQLLPPVDLPGSQLTFSMTTAAVIIRTLVRRVLTPRLPRRGRGRRDARRPFKRRVSETAIAGPGSAYFWRGRASRRVDGPSVDDAVPLLLLPLPRVDVSRSRRLECRYHSENNPLRKQPVTRHGVGWPPPDWPAVPAPCDSSTWHDLFFPLSSLSFSLSHSFFLAFSTYEICSEIRCALRDALSRAHVEEPFPPWMSFSTLMHPWWSSHVPRVFPTRWHRGHVERRREQCAPRTLHRSLLRFWLARQPRRSISLFPQFAWVTERDRRFSSKLDPIFVFTQGRRRGALNDQEPHGHLENVSSD